VETLQLLRDEATRQLDLVTLLREVATAWQLKSPPPAALTQVSPSSRFGIIGAGAVIAMVELAQTMPGLDLGAQAILLADDPGTRQLFGLAVALLGGRGKARAQSLAAALPENLDFVVISGEAPAQLKGIATV
jgi:hypothetical protein